jgi:uncharacterized protein YdeI (BOF family)
LGNACGHEAVKSPEEPTFSSRRSEHLMKRKLFAVRVCGCAARWPQMRRPGSRGPGLAAPGSRLGQPKAARLGSHVSLSGSIVAHQRENHFTFRDSSGEIRVEIAPAL